MRCAIATLFVCIFLAGCAEETRDAVVEVEYHANTVAQGMQRRIDLLGAGVRLRPEHAVEKVWRNIMGYRFVARAPEGESGVAGLRSRREGVLVKEKARGITQGSLGLFKVEEGYWIVDIYSSVDTYLKSAVAPRDMADWRLLHHLRLTRPLSETADRFLLEPREQVYWRTLLPVVRRNKGYGFLYQKEKKSDSDTTRVMGERYKVEELGDYVLVGKAQPGARFWHVFTGGEVYLRSIVSFGPGELAAVAALQQLDLKLEHSD
ncbi:MAG: hypothetical protein GKR89_19225 [Candidatus Latescibacteria bacterium]|nr:hypothetical protein [Candidatus Latescibacterota bacterium]